MRKVNGEWLREIGRGGDGLSRRPRLVPGRRADEEEEEEEDFPLPSGGITDPIWVFGWAGVFPLPCALTVFFKFSDRSTHKEWVFG